MSRRFTIPVWLAALLTAGAVCGETPLERGIDAWRAAQRIWDGAAMEEARTNLAAVAAQRPGEYVPLYWQGVAEFYLTLYYGLDDSSGYSPVQAEAARAAAEPTLKAAVDADAEDAECRAMLSCVYGFRIAEHPLTAIWLGPRVLSLQKAALKKGADNPRVHYLIGAAYQGAPDIFRNPDKAEMHLTRAETLYREENAAPGGPYEPRWGFAECLGLLGDVLLEKGDTAAARRYYQAALEVNPHYAPASKRLKGMEPHDEP